MKREDFPRLKFLGLRINLIIHRPNDRTNANITFAQLQRFVELESRGAGFHPGHFQTRVTTLRVHAERLIGRTGSR